MGHDLKLRGMTIGRFPRSVFASLVLCSLFGPGHSPECSALTIQRQWTRARSATSTTDDIRIANHAAGKPLRVWVAFRDKGVFARQALDTELRAVKAHFDLKALSRRNKHGRMLDFTDLPVFPEYIDTVAGLGAKIRSESRWFNAVGIEADAGTVARIHKLPFVASIEPIGVRRSVRPRPDGQAAKTRASKTSEEYGLTLRQLESVNVIPLLERGLSGEGVRIGVLDAGFQPEEHVAFAKLKVIAEHDFVFDDDEAGNEDGDDIGAAGHGTAVLSILAGYDPPNYVGLARNAEVVLAKTEWQGPEVRQEEDYWVEGVEWVERLGADMVTTSLGYLDFDDGFVYQPDELDGRTAVTTIAAQEAFLRGLVIIASAGNDGANSGPVGTVGTPADAEGVIAAGAVNDQFQRAGFSSVGPTADGRIKPDVMAHGSGSNVIRFGTVDEYTSGSGTSYAAPTVAGVAALLMESHPDWTAADIREALIRTATQADNPDNLNGHGRVDAVAADAYPIETAVVDWADY